MSALVTGFEDLEAEEAEVIIPVDIRGVKYELREILGDDALTYKNEVARCAKFTAEGKMTQTTGLPATQHLLVSLCLYKKGTNQRVTKEEVAKFPQKKIQRCFLAILRVNEMGGVETIEDLKKERAELDERIRAMEEEAATLKNE